MNISFFDNGIKNTKKPETMSILDIFGMIKDGKWENPVNLYRETKDQAIKESLPYYTVSGTFSERGEKHLIEHSGLIAIDLDHLDDSVDDVKDILAADPSTYMIAKSCSGQGLCVIIKIDPKQHKEAFAYIEMHYKEAYNIKKPIFNYLDDVSRARFVSYDPEAIVREDAQVVIIPESFIEYLKPKAKPLHNEPPKYKADSNHPYIKKCINNTLESIRDKIKNAPDGEKHFNLVRASFWAGGLIASGYIGEHEAKDILEYEISLKAPRSMEAAVSTINSGIEKGKQKPIYFEVPLPNNIAAKNDEPKAFSEETIKKDVIWETPRFDDMLYQYLPDPLPELLNLFDEGRKKDMALVCLLTSLSGLFPEVKGLYGGKETFPNLYGFVCAPPGTGKGVIDYAADIGYEIQQEINAENEQALANWAMECDDLKQRKIRDMPEKPILKRLYIPANATNKALQNALAHNPNGLIGIETEADTITTMFKTEHGDFSDLLRKAFEHEKIANLRVTAESTEAENPKLSFLIAGTPDQLPKLIKSADNGLFSRFMFYGFDDIPSFKDPFSSTVNFRQEFRARSGYIRQIRNSGGFDFTFSDDQRVQFTNKYKSFTKRYYKLSGKNATSVVFRMGKMLFKICMTLTRIAYGTNNLTGQNVECPDSIFMAGDMFAEKILKHSFIMLDGLQATQIENKKPESQDQIDRKESTRSKNMLLDSLPKNFTTSECIKIGAGLGIPERSVQRNLKKYQEKGLIEKEAKGVYLKIIQ